MKLRLLSCSGCFYVSLYHFALQYVHKQEAAEKVVNDVFVNIWKQRASLLSIQNLESYLFIAVTFFGFAFGGVFLGSVAPGPLPMVLLMYTFYSFAHLRSVTLTTEDE